MTDARIASLEQKLSEMQAELAALKGKAAPQAASPKDEGVRVVEIFNERTVGMPNLREMERLYARVKPFLPWPQALNDRFDEHRPFRAFSSSFRWVQNMGRTERPNGKVALSFWLDTCRTWLRARNCVASDLDTNALVLAVYAAGDVHFTPADPAVGNVWEIGIVEYGGRKASDAWRNVMQTGNILPPSMPARLSAPISVQQLRVMGR